MVDSGSIAMCTAVARWRTSCLPTVPSWSYTGGELASQASGSSSNRLRTHALVFAAMRGTGTYSARSCHRVPHALDSSPRGGTRLRDGDLPFHRRFHHSGARGSHRGLREAIASTPTPNRHAAYGGSCTQRHIAADPSRS